MFTLSSLVAIPCQLRNWTAVEAKLVITVAHLWTNGCVRNKVARWQLRTASVPHRTHTNAAGRGGWFLGVALDDADSLPRSVWRSAGNGGGEDSERDSDSWKPAGGATSPSAARLGRAERGTPERARGAAAFRRYESDGGAGAGAPGPQRPTARVAVRARPAAGPERPGKRARDGCAAEGCAAGTFGRTMAGAAGQ